MATSVAVLGGGVAGLSAAHELAERGFTVTVHEKRAVPGGKARSTRSGRGRRRADCRPSTASASSPASTATCRTRWRGSRPAPPPCASASSAPSGSCSPKPADATSWSPPRMRPRRSATSRRSRRFVFSAATHDRHPGRRGRVPDRAAARAADQLRRAPLRAVGPAELVGLRRGRPAFAGVPQVPGRRPDPHAGRRARERDERADRRADPRAAAAGPLPRGRAARTACSTRRPATRG